VSCVVVCVRVRILSRLVSWGWANLINVVIYVVVGVVIGSKEGENGSVRVAGAPALDYGLIPAYGAGIITPNGNHPPVVLRFAKGQSPF
jgi:hypothetical protein